MKIGLLMIFPSNFGQIISQNNNSDKIFIIGG